MTALREIVVFIRSMEGQNCAIVPRRAEGNSPIPRAYKNNYFSNIKAVINTFICRKKSQLMTPPWPFSSLSARLFFHECIFESRLDLDSSLTLSKIFLQFWGWAGPVGNMEKNLRFHMTPHLLSITFRITSNISLNLWQLKHRPMQHECDAQWPMHRDVCNLYGKDFSTRVQTLDLLTRIQAYQIYFGKKLWRI